MAKTIGLLTSGGDCAGLNAVIRAVVLRANALGMQVLGIRDGTHGLLDNPPRATLLHADAIESSILRQGGTILGTSNKGNPFAWPMDDGSTQDRSGDFIRGVRALGLDALIGIGGDGSLAILRRLCQQGGIGLVGIPKTIDNDVGLTEVSVGFDTAVAVATEALDRLQPTAASHARVMILEVMGRDAGHIALEAGIAGGADMILIPEIPVDLACIAAKIANIRAKGRNFALIIVSEAVKTAAGGPLMVKYTDGQQRFGGIGQYIAHELAEMTGAETRVTVLGHVQRGAAPSHRDRIIATGFGVRAVDLVHQGQFDRMVAWANRQVVDMELAKAIEHYQAVSPHDSLIHTARAVGICLGDR